MTVSVKQLVRRHGALVAGVTAASVGAVLVVQRLLRDLVGLLAVLPYLEGQAYPPDISGALLIAVPFALGYFLSLWLLAPIAEELRVGHVITRAVLAAGVGSTLVFVALAVLALLGALSFDGALFANSFPAPRFDGAGAVSGLAGALTTALSTLLATLPLGVLGGVLLWLWRKNHPPRHPVSGLIDEV